MQSEEILFVTGHRPNKLGGYRNRWTKPLLSELAISHIRMIYPQGGITGMALGWDTICARAFLDCNIPYIAAIPFEGQEKLWNRDDRREYEFLLEKASEVIIVNKGDFAPWKFQTRNQWMVNNGTRGIAMWNGSPGGTANCIKYAEQVHKPVDNLWEQYAGH